MSLITDLLTKYIQAEDALEYLNNLNRNNYSRSTFFGWGFSSVDGDKRVIAIKNMLFNEQILLAEQINELSGFSYKPEY